MTRKDYIIIAEVLNPFITGQSSDYITRTAARAIARKLALVFNLQNERFDTDKFLDACGIDQ